MIKEITMTKKERANILDILYNNIVVAEIDDSDRALVDYHNAKNEIMQMEVDEDDTQRGEKEDSADCQGV